MGGGKTHELGCDVKEPGGRRGVVINRAPHCPQVSRCDISQEVAFAERAKRAHAHMSEPSVALRTREL